MDDSSAVETRADHALVVVNVRIFVGLVFAPCSPAFKALSLVVAEFAGTFKGSCRGSVGDDSGDYDFKAHLD